MISTVAFLASLLILSQEGEGLPQLPPNAFAGFESHNLANGLKVWYKRLPDDPVVSISVAFPFGADHDPVGKEQLAHFTEHMLFSDQPGRTEEEIKRELEELGGVYNASVTADRTFYFVRIGKQHALFALDWLYRILAPHAMTPEVVERQREPVALEVGARPRQFFDWVWAVYLNPPALRLPGFWEREFGIETRATRDYYPYASLNRIESEDLSWYYNTHYVPSLMTLTIVGDLERQPVFDKITETFAYLPARPEPDLSRSPRDPRRYRQSVLWAYRSNVFYSNRFKFYDLTAEQEVMAIFVSQFFRKRLNDKLRFGERKATYGLAVGIAKRSGAGYLGISGGIRDSEFDFARGVVESELEALRSGSLPADEFEADRSAVVRQLRVSSTSSQDLEGWVRAYFYDRRVYEDFPDVAAAFDGYSQAEVEEFVRRQLVHDRQVLFVVHPHPITQGLLALLVVILVRATIYWASRLLTRPVDMTRLRYVARFYFPRLYFWTAALALVALVAIVGRMLIFGFELLVDRYLITLDSFLLQWLTYAFMLAATVFFLVLVMARIPRKLLVFEDQLLIKYLSFRSVTIGFTAISEISLRRFPDVWLSKRLWRCLPLALGILSPAVYLRSVEGRAYFFNVRDKRELLTLVENLREASTALET